MRIWAESNSKIQEETRENVQFNFKILWWPPEANKNRKYEEIYYTCLEIPRFINIHKRNMDIVTGIKFYIIF